jgi:toxin FitB
MTVFTVMEIQVGIERVRVNDAAVAMAIGVWLDGLIAAGQPQLLGFDAQAARLFGRMHETPALRNFVLSPSGSKRGKTGADLAIAAIAIVQGASIATHNVKDFRLIHAHFPLPGLFDPFADDWPVRPSPDPTS